MSGTRRKRRADRGLAFRWTGSGVVHQFEVVPLQRLRHIEAGLGQIDAVVLRRVRRRRLPRERVLAVRVRSEPGRAPLGAGGVERRVLVTTRAAQLPVGDQFPVSPVGVADVDLHPVVEGLGIRLPRLGAQRVVRMQEIAGVDARGRVLGTAMSLGGARTHHRQPRHGHRPHDSGDHRSAGQLHDELLDHRGHIRPWWHIGVVKPGIEGHRLSHWGDGQRPMSYRADLLSTAVDPSVPLRDGQSHRCG